MPAAASQSDVRKTWTLSPLTYWAIREAAAAKSSCPAKAKPERPGSGSPHHSFETGHCAGGAIDPFAAAQTAASSSVSNQAFTLPEKPRRRSPSGFSVSRRQHIGRTPRKPDHCGLVRRRSRDPRHRDRKSVVKGKSVAVRVDLGGRRTI